MLLSARILENVSSANAYDLVNQTKMSEGDTMTVYLQLIDASKDRADQGFNPAGRRYIPAAGATLSVTLENLDDAKKLVKTASNPSQSSRDPSIWSFTILASDSVKGTVNLKLSLNEGGKVTTGLVKAAIGVESVTGM